MSNQRFFPRFPGGRFQTGNLASLQASLQASLSAGLAMPLHLARTRLARSLLLRPGLESKRPAGPATLGRIGNLEVRLAASPAEIRKAQKLRYRVFFEEMSAVASAAARRARRDADAFDAICDHLLVIDHGAPRKTAASKLLKFSKPGPAIVGTYRLLRQAVADAHGGFYTQGEYDIAPLITAHPQLNFLELGRSCVLEPYRDKRTVELLWHGIWAYVLQHGIDVMLGCASLAGTDPDRLAMPLSFLHQVASPPAEWQVRALEARREPMDRLPPEAIDHKAALKALPPLIKGYLRLGGFVGDGAVVDHDFGTTDVLIVLPVANINPRYIAHYGADAGRYAS